MKRKNGKIELLRFVMVFIIVLHHSGRIGGVINLFPRGSLAVEFFFLVSGYLMTAHCYKQQNIRYDALGQETIRFIFSKIRSFFLLMVLAEGFALLIYLMTTELSGKGDIIRVLFAVVNECFLLNMTGFRMKALNATWYLSAMIIAMMVLYPLCRKYYDAFTHFIAPVWGTMVIGALYLAFGTQTGPNEVVLGVMYRGLLRSIAEISLGAASFEIARWLQQLKLTKLGSVCIGALELMLYLVVIVLMMGSSIEFDTLILYILFVAVTLSFSHKGRFDSYFDNNLCYQLGKFSLPLYLGHIYLTDLINKLSLIEPKLKLCLYVILSLCSALILQQLEKLVRQILTNWKERLIVLR